MAPVFWVVLSMSHSTTESGAFKKPRDRDQTLELYWPLLPTKGRPQAVHTPQRWFYQAWFRGWGLREGSAHWFWGGMQRCVTSSGEWGALPEARPCLSEQETMPRRGGALAHSWHYGQLSFLIGNTERPVSLCFLKTLQSRKSICKQMGFIPRDSQMLHVCS